MAYPAYEDNGGIAAGGEAGVDVPYPSTVNANDILVIVMMDADNDTFTIPTGTTTWYRIHADSASANCSYDTFWTRAAGTETGTITVNSALSAGSLVAGIMYRFSGCRETGTPFEIPQEKVVNQNTSASTLLDPTETTWLDRLVVQFQILEDNYTIVADTGEGFTQSANDGTTTGSDCQFGIQTKQMATAGAISSDDYLVWSWGGTNEYHGDVLVAFINNNIPPTTVLDTADGYDFGTDTTPTLAFTGTDADTDDITYQIQIATVDTFVSDSLSAYDSWWKVDPGLGSFKVGDPADSIATGQSFKNSSVTGTLSSCLFAIFTIGTPTGYVSCKIYAHTGTYGSGGVPTGSALAVSEGIRVASIAPFSGDEPTRITFNFYGDNRITLTADTAYCAVVCYTGTASNHLRIQTDVVGPPFHAGNTCVSDDESTWDYGNLSYDLNFEVKYITSAGNVVLDKSSLFHEGFFRSGDSDPFTSGQQVTYTVPADEALVTDTYYWRVRGIDRTGVNEWGDYPSDKYFDVDTSGGVEINLFDNAFTTEDITTFYQIYNIDLYDGGFTTEDITALIPVYNIDLYDFGYTTESITFSIDANIDLYDFGYTTENITFSIDANIDLYDEGFTTEDITFSIDANIDLYDEGFTTEDTTIDRIGGALPDRDINIEIEYGYTTEDITFSIDANIDLYDEGFTTESTLLSLVSYIDLYDEGFTTESITALIPLYYVDLYDDAFTTESLNLTRVDPGAFVINVYDDARTTEDTTFFFDLYLLSVFDDIYTIEFIELSRENYIFTYEDTFTTEDITALIPVYNIDLYDEGFTTEDITALIPVYNIDLYYEGFTTEDITALIFITLTGLGITELNIVEDTEYGYMLEDIVIETDALGIVAKE
jgi:hypothetical protein